MKSKDVLQELFAGGYLDERGIYAYGQASAGLRYLVTVCGEKVTVFESNHENEAVKIILTAPAGSLKHVECRTGLLHLHSKIAFTYNAVPYRFTTGTVAGKCVAFFKALSKR